MEIQINTIFCIGFKSSENIEYTGVPNICVQRLPQIPGVNLKRFNEIYLSPNLIVKELQGVKVFPM